MPEFKTYRAETMQQALIRVKQELGPDALILHTRQIPVKPRLPWQKERVEAEIVAVIEEAEPWTRQAEISNHSHVPSLPDPPQHLEREPDPNHSHSQRIQQIIPDQPSPSPSQESSQLEEFVKQRLDSLQAMVEQLTTQVQTGIARDIPPELIPLYTELREADVEETLSRSYLDRMKLRLSGLDFNNPEAARSELAALLEADIRCHGPIELTPGQRKIVALVGPTGVGKTTTIAKLAANFRLRDHIRMGLVTVDTYRIAAVEQLRTYADIIDLPMKVVTSASEMKQAVDDFADKDLILIDTAGRSPRDELKLQELRDVLAEIIVDEIHLVLSATTSFRHLQNTVQQFHSVRPDAAILTKLDEAPGLGAIVNTTSQLGLPLSYFTTGQIVPHDIEPAHPIRATHLILGEEVIQ